MSPEILTLGHSNHPYATFAGLLMAAGATAVADVRSSPFSRRNAHFSGPALKAALASDGIAYVFLGDALGGRPALPAMYRDGVADYEAMAASAAFRGGLSRIIDGSARHRIALVCSEAAPADCHRCLLCGGVLKEAGMAVRHLLAGGGHLGQREVEDSLLAQAGAGADLFSPAGGDLAKAYRARTARVGWRASSQGRP